jgi:hypothetical protein
VKRIALPPLVRPGIFPHNYTILLRGTGNVSRRTRFSTPRVMKNPAVIPGLCDGPKSVLQHGSVFAF